MQVVTGAMGALIPKLFQLLSEEYNLQKGVKQDVEFLTKELPSMHEALRKVADVPRDKLDRQVKIWADEVRELSYVMEDVVDSFMASVEGSEPAANSNKLKELLKKMGNLIPKGKTRRKIAKKIKGIRIQVREVADRRDRYWVNDAVANLAAAPTTVDPRLLAQFKDQKELVGIDAARDEITKKLTDGDGDVPKKQLKILSIVGIGGLGKTTVAKVVYEGLQGKFMLKAFVSVGQKPDVKKVLRNIFLELDKEGYRKSNAQTLDERQLIVELQELLANKRYFIVIDDIWDVQAWEIIRCAFKDSNYGSKIITTTRSFEVARKSGEAYQLKALSPGNSEKLLYMRLYGGRSKCPFDHPLEISEKIIQRCGGVPLAILTIASLLDGKVREDWSKVYDSIGFGHGKNQVVDNTRKILLFSYYDLPYYLRSCLLYLSIYPEDYAIRKHTLIWKWVGEGFITEEQGIGQYELGERYFNELVNRSMIQPIWWGSYGTSFVAGCCVHDLVLDMICLLSNDDNFVRVWDVNDQRMSCQSNARRLAIQKRVLEQDDCLGNMCTTQLRSFSATRCGIHVMPSLSSFGALRVLDMENCSFSRDDGSYHLDHLGSLIHLRYLGLRNMPIDKLPEEIGNLKFLQTLDLVGTSIEELPQSFCLLRQLKCLRYHVVTGRGLHLLGNLTSLEELQLTFLDWSTEFVAELGKLVMMRNLVLYLFVGLDGSHVKALVKSLGKLQKMQVLDIQFVTCMSTAPHVWESYVPPRQLRKLSLIMERDMLPAWINQSLVPNLTSLWFMVKEVKSRDMEILGSLPELVTLVLTGLGLSDSQDFLPDVMGGLFPKLRYFRTPAPQRFLQGAMPSLEFLEYYFLQVEQLKRDSSFVFDFGSWGNLHSLQKVQANILPNAAQENEDEAVVALELAANQHPNRPNLTVQDC